MELRALILLSALVLFGHMFKTDAGCVRQYQASWLQPDQYIISGVKAYQVVDIQNLNTQDQGATSTIQVVSITYPFPTRTATFQANMIFPVVDVAFNTYKVSSIMADGRVQVFDDYNDLVGMSLPPNNTVLLEIVKKALADANGDVYAKVATICLSDEVVEITNTPQ